MIKKSLNNMLILSCALLSYQAYAQAVVNKEQLSQQCNNLSNTIANLVSIQNKTPCIKKLMLGSRQIKYAGRFISQENFTNAKQFLDDAIFSLHHAELSSCNQYIQIAHSKLETKKIKKQVAIEGS